VRYGLLDAWVFSGLLMIGCALYGLPCPLSLAPAWRRHQMKFPASCG